MIVIENKSNMNSENVKKILWLAEKIQGKIREAQTC